MLMKIICLKGDPSGKNNVHWEFEKKIVSVLNKHTTLKLNVFGEMTNHM